MIQKNPEDRYQSAFGVWKDLEQTHQFLTSSGSIPTLIERLSFSHRVSEDVFVSDLQTIGQNRQQQQRKANDQILPFELGRFDHSPFLKQQSQLYFRDAEMDQIESYFSLVLSSKKSRLMSVYGFSGIGKTRLITEAVRQIKKGLSSQTLIFASGKFEQFNSSIPFVGFKHLFENLLLQFSLVFDVSFLKSTLLHTLDHETLGLLIDNDLIPGLSKLFKDIEIEKPNNIRPVELQTR